MALLPAAPGLVRPPPEVRVLLVVRGAVEHAQGDGDDVEVEAADGHGEG